MKTNLNYECPNCGFTAAARGLNLETSEDTAYCSRCGYGHDLQYGPMDAERLEEMDLTAPPDLEKYSIIGGSVDIPFGLYTEVFIGGHKGQYVLEDETDFLKLLERLKTPPSDLSEVVLIQYKNKEKVRQVLYPNS